MIQLTANELRKFNAMNIQFKPKTGSRGIEWCDGTFNILAGCVFSCVWEMMIEVQKSLFAEIDDNITTIQAGCYAKSVAEGVAQQAYPHGFEHPYFFPDRIDEVKRKSKAMLLFATSMTDWMSGQFADEMVEQAIALVTQSPQHIHQILSKNPMRYLKFDGWQKNMWLGFSSAPEWMAGKRLNDRAKHAYMRRGLDAMAELRQKGQVTFGSFEPLSWNVAPFLESAIERHNCKVLDWIILGPATNGRKAYQPEPKNMQNMLDVCDAYQIPVFFKGTLVWDVWREDFPAIAHPALWNRQQNAIQHGWTLNTYFDTSLFKGMDVKEGVLINA